MQQDYDSSASGYLTDSFEGISQEFTDVEILNTSEVNVVAKAKRYGRWWLLKSLRQEIAQETGYQQRLRKELDILMSLQHPAVVTAVGLEEVKNIGLCIVMEYVDGVTLNGWLQEKHSRKERRRIGNELVMAVGYIHSKGIVHRDLKPQNIIITQNGENLKLIDFGLADTDSYSILKQPAGTLKYMSPEQMQTPIADVRNDIYSLGVIFKQMDLGYGYIINRCMQPIEKRYRNIAELQSAIRERPHRRNRLLMAVFAIGIAIFIGTTLIQTTHHQQPSSLPAMQQDTMQNVYRQRDIAYQEKPAESQQTVPVSHNKVSNESSNSEQKQQVRQSQIDETIENGKRAVDEAQLKIQPYIDKVTKWDYTNKICLYHWLNAFGEKGVREYCEKQRGKFDTNDMIMIEQSLNEYRLMKEKEWNRKISTLFEQHQQESAKP